MTSQAFFSSLQSLNHPHRINAPIPKPQSSPYLRPFNVDSTVCACAGSPIGRTRRIKTMTMIRTPSSVKASSDSTAIVDDPSVASSSGAEAASSYTEEEEKAMSKVGSRVRVKVNLKVYHIPKVPEVELQGMEGVLKQYVGIWKGKRISATFPFKVAFVAELEGREGPVKFFSHLKEDEFEYLD